MRAPHTDFSPRSAASSTSAARQATYAPWSGYHKTSSTPTAADSSACSAPSYERRLLVALPPGILRVGQEVTSFEQEERAVTLTFADGHTEPNGRRQALKLRPTHRGFRTWRRRKSRRLECFAVRARDHDGVTVRVRDPYLPVPWPALALRRVSMRRQNDGGV
jgi:hypothetical protein